jgi:hypothetical protein
MSEAGRSTGFLGWHHHKLKWLDAERVAYLAKNGQALELTSLSGSSGASMIVVPGGWLNPEASGTASCYLAGFFNRSTMALPMASPTSI